MAGGAYVAFSSPAHTPLYAGLAEADKAAVSEALQAAGIAYSIDPQSGSVNVAQDQVHQARIALAGQGLPKAQPTGNTLMADMPMGASRAVEGETLRAVRETELARTIEAIDAVQLAKVHIGTPEPSPFVQENRPATASVMLTLEGGRSLSDGQVQAIRFLVASLGPWPRCRERVGYRPARSPAFGNGWQQRYGNIPSYRPGSRPVCVRRSTG